MEKDSGTVFRELKEDVSAYVELKLELLKLSTYERTGKVIAVLSYGLILLFLAFFCHLVHILGLGLLPRGLVLAPPGSDSVSWRSCTCYLSAL